MRVAKRFEQVKAMIENNFGNFQIMINQREHNMRQYLQVPSDGTRCFGLSYQYVGLIRAVQTLELTHGKNRLYYTTCLCG